MCLYERKTEQRDQLKEQAQKSLLFLLRQMQGGVCHSTEIAEQMRLLSQRLKNTGGKKVYGYLKADVKAIVNHIVDTATYSLTIKHGMVALQSGNARIMSTTMQQTAPEVSSQMNR